MEPYVGEIRLFAGTYAPLGWCFCYGAELLIKEYETLFTLIGTTYGGDGITTFKLPDLRGRVMIGQGAGPNLTPRAIPATGGASTVRLAEANLPPHRHSVTVSNQAGTTPTVEGTSVTLANMPPISGGGVAAYTDKTVAAANKILPLAADTVQSSGGGWDHDNVMPSIGLNYIISTKGIFPSRP